jgi:ElaB/YqjD/DUF883 family membrane-anchored ribosome-binding protein
VPRISRNLHREIEELRREIDALRAAQSPAPKTDDRDAKEPSQAETGELIEGLRGLAHEAAAFAQNSEDYIENNPLMSTVVALVIGIAIGRFLHR